MNSKVFFMTVCLLALLFACSNRTEKRSDVPQTDTLAVSYSQKVIDSTDINETTNIKQDIITRPIIHTVDVTDEFNSYYLSKQWIAEQSFDMYRDDSFVEKISNVNKGDKFKILLAKYNFHHCMKVKITKLLPNDSDECDMPFSIGDEISLLYTMGECEWTILYKEKENFAMFSWDEENNRVTESLYDGCHKIEGDIIKKTESYTLVMKVIDYTTNKIGYSRIVHDDNGIWDKFQPHFE